MSNLLQRVIMFVFFIPLIIALIVFADQWQHLALQLAAVLVAALLAGEVARLYDILPPLKSEKMPMALRSRFLRYLAVLACGLLPVLGRMAVSYHLLPPAAAGAAVTASFVLPILWIYASQVVMSQYREIDYFLRRTHGYLMIVVYPALGVSFFLGIIALPQSSVLLLVFLGSVFLNDTFAYLGGRFLGKKSNHPFRISPNKTLIGFVCGFAASVACLFAGWAFAPQLFAGGVGAVAAIGVLMGFGTILGDLFESGLKRSFGAKDSGTVILGRGGMLDSLDSLLFCAPLFYFSYTLLNAA